jgi:hypothetical protein
VAPKTKERSPDMTGTLCLQRHTAALILKAFDNTDDDEAVCDIAAWVNHDHEGQYLTVEISPKYMAPDPQMQHARAISKQAWLDEMSELLGQMEQTEREEKEEEISEEEWLAQMKQEEELYRAKERTRLEEEAKYSWVASERLRTLIEKEEEQKALAVCAEDERRREAIKAEAEESPLNWLFAEPEKEDAL